MTDASRQPGLPIIIQPVAPEGERRVSEISRQPGVPMIIQPIAPREEAPVVY